MDGLDDLAMGADALVDFEAHGALDQVAGLDPVQVEGAGADHALDAEDIAESTGGDEADVGPAALDEEIGADGGAVDEIGDGVEVDTGLGEDVEDAAGGVVRSGEGLGFADGAGGFQGDEIGEGAANVDCDADAHGVGSLRRMSAPPLSCRSCAMLMLMRRAR